jgi:pyruvate/2-oxoglutarate dehydrogenase complex dihydrolipoamide dehydrogenase (E3) component
MALRPERKTEVAKLSKKMIEKLIAARVQRAVVGFQIPMMSIPKLYKVLEDAVASGKSDEDLKAAVAAFPGVAEA